MIYFLKFLHVVIALGLLGLVLFCTIAVRSIDILRCNRVLLGLSFCALLTGTVLVYPRHFTFHTPWIVAAYLFLGLFSVLVFLMMILFRKKILSLSLARWVYGILAVILMVIVHDAVVKGTLL